MGADIVRIQFITEQSKGCCLLRRAVGEQRPVESGQDLRHFQHHVFFLHLFEDGDHHVLLTVHPVAVSGGKLTVTGLAHPHIVETCLSIHELEARFIVAAAVIEVALQVVPNAAHDIDDLFYRFHGHGIVVIHVDTAQHPLGSFAYLFKTFAVFAEQAIVLAVRAAVQRSVQLVYALYAGYIRIGIPWQRDQVHSILVEVDGANDHHIGMEGIPTLAGPILIDTSCLIVHTNKHDIDDAVHHARIGNFRQFLIGIGCDHRRRGIGGLRSFCRVRCGSCIRGRNGRGYDDRCRGDLHR